MVKVIDIAKDVWREEGLKPLLVRTLKYIRFKYRMFYRKTFAGIIIFFQPHRYFIFKRHVLNQFYHRHNYTWTNERCVEIPIIMEYICDTDFKRMMEFGCVLPHYELNMPGATIIDKYEKMDWVINEDIVDFKPNKKYGLIVSISTIEHVGYDSGEEKDDTKIVGAIENMKRCLTKKGLMVLTTGVGYNPNMDKVIFGRKIRWTNKYFLKRVSKHEWEEVRIKEAKSVKYDYPFEGANCVVVLELKNG